LSYVKCAKCAPDRINVQAYRLATMIDQVEAGGFLQ
jgi:hypothetical protein